MVQYFLSIYFVACRKESFFRIKCSGDFQKVECVRMLFVCG